jgi:hypothetical protein
MKTPQRRQPTRKSAKPVAAAPAARQHVGRGSPARRRQGRTLRYVLIEIVIVSIGVLLALGVDAGRRAIQDGQRTREVRAAFAEELEINRQRVLRKMDRVRWAYRTTSARPDQAPGAVAQPGGNLIILLFDTAWQGALATDGLRLLSGPERAALSELYASQASLFARQEAEMALWDDLSRYPNGASATPEEARQRDAHLRRWWLAATRLHHHSCRHLMRVRAVSQRRPLALNDTERCETTGPLDTDLRQWIAAQPAR